MSKAQFSSMVIPSLIPRVHHPCLPLSILLPRTVTPAAAASSAVFGFRGGARAAAQRPRTSHGDQYRCKARRRMRHEEEEEEEEDGEEYGQNLELSLMEAYSEQVRDVALLVRATVDGEEELVLVFKGFSSRLSSRTSSDQWKSVLPSRALIESIDVVKGPFDPSNIDYLEKDLTWEAFKANRLQLKSTN